MRLRDDPQPATPNPSSSQQQPTTTTRQSRKRKTPPTPAPAPPPLNQHPQHPPPGIHLGQMLPPPHALIPPGMGHPPMYQYAPPEYAQPPPPPGEPSEQHLNGQDLDPSDELSQSKRAEQNRKAQRAFRERRDQYVQVPHASSVPRVKALESRSQLLDAALASADEANRRWEECRALTQIGGSLAPGQILAGQPPQQPHQAQESRLEGEKLETPKS
ncbi:hypothetical protein EV363DRAFT_1320709 [Boletus edulis]|nr:hypothetical protein EV363DRAFT_1320709 [Boletus edulis]